MEAHGTPETAAALTDRTWDPQTSGFPFSSKPKRGTNSKEGTTKDCSPAMTGTLSRMVLLRWDLEIQGDHTFWYFETKYEPNQGTKGEKVDSPWKTESALQLLSFRNSAKQGLNRCSVLRISISSAYRRPSALSSPFWGLPNENRSPNNKTGERAIQDCQQQIALHQGHHVAKVNFGWLVFHAQKAKVLAG